MSLLFGNPNMSSIKYGGSIIDKIKWNNKIRKTIESTHILSMIDELEKQLDDYALINHHYAMHCPRCGRNLNYGGHRVDRGYVYDDDDELILDTEAIKCDNCKHRSIWIYGILPGAPCLYTSSLEYIREYRWCWGKSDRGYEPEPDQYKKEIKT